MSLAGQTIRIATRGSALALAQAYKVQEICQLKKPAWTFEIAVIRTTGDKLQSISLANPEKSLPKGLFTKEIEEALLGNTADIAVHSLKDLPTVLPDGLKLGAVPERRDVRDVFICRSAASLGDNPWISIPGGATIASSSLRRKSQILQTRPDLHIVEIRGNVGTRLQKIKDNHHLYGTILALAGMERLGMTIQPGGQLIGPDVPEGLSAIPIPLDQMLPCVGQAALGLEIRMNDPVADELCIALNCSVAWFETHAERAFLRELGGGCQSPIAAHASYADGAMDMKVMVDVGGHIFRNQSSGSLEDAENLGANLAHSIRHSQNHAGQNPYDA